MIALANDGDCARQEQTLIDLFFQHYKPRQLRATTKKNARLFGISLNQFARHLKRTPTTCHLTDEIVENFCYWCVEDRGLSPYTANCYRSKIVALWRFLAERRIVDQFPTLGKMHEPRRIPRAWTPEQLSRLFRACDELTGNMGDIPASLWWHAIHAVIWDTGERISAVLSLRWDDLAMDTGFIVSKAENRKGKTEDKAFRLHSDTLTILERLQGYSHGETLFPIDCSLATIYNRYRRLLQSAGLPSDRWCKFHKIRRSVASYFEAAGGDATKLLGHSSRKVTIQSYLDPTITDTKHASDLLFRPDK